MPTLTVKQLADRLADLPTDAEVYIYVGPEGVMVQAEWAPLDINAPSRHCILRSPMCVPEAGGPAE